MPPLVYLQNKVHNSIMMKCHYPDLGSAFECLTQEDQSEVRMWVVTRHQYEISLLVPQMTFCTETISEIEKCWLFSQATNSLSYTHLQSILWRLALSYRKHQTHQKFPF